MEEYIVVVSNTYTAKSPEDAVAQMAAWLVDYAYVAGYRVISNSLPDTKFIDAESIDYDSLEEE